MSWDAQKTLTWATVGALATLGVFTMHTAASLGSDGTEVLVRQAGAEPLDESLNPAQLAYEVQHKTVQGDVTTVHLSEVLGTHGVVFLNFWATYCPPCIEEFPSLLTLARAHPMILFVAVSYDASWEDIERFMKKSSSLLPPDNFVVVLDPNRGAERDLKGLFGTEKIPESYLIRQGTVRLRFVGARDWRSPAFYSLLARMAGLPPATR